MPATLTTAAAEATAAGAFTARHRYARLTARKARLIADLIRGKSVNSALEQLEFAPQRAATFYLKVLRSAVANASQHEGVNLNELFVSDCRADDGPLLNNRMRFRPGPQGRAMPFAKRTCHLTLTVAEQGATLAASEAPSAAGEKTTRKAAKKAAKKTAKKTTEKQTTKGSASSQEAKGAEDKES